MANVISNLPMPVLNGPGAAVDVSTMGRDKTIVITGDYPGATITVEVSEEAGGAGAYAPLYTFQTGDTQKVIPVAARYMRVNVANRKSTVPFTATADVASDDIGTTFAVLTLPTLNGPGTAVNVSTLGEYKTFVVGGSFPGARILIEASDDGTNFAPVTQFTSYGGQVSQALISTWLRTNVAGRNATLPFSASVAVGAIVDPGAPPAPVAVPGGSTCYIYQPGGGQTGPGTFDTWGDLMTALATARAGANGSGCYTIQFDDAFTTPAAIPAGAYDMTNVTWEGTDRMVAVAIDDGASFTGLRMFAGPLNITNNNLAAPAVTDLADGEIVRVRTTWLSTATDGFAFYDAAALAPGDEVKVYFDEHAALGVTDIGPVFKFPTLTTLDLAFDPSSYIAGTTAVAAPAGATLNVELASLQMAPTVYPNWAGSVVEPQVDCPPSLLPEPYRIAPSTAAFAAGFGQWLRFNASGGPIAQLLPAISAAPNGFSAPGCFVLVSESGGGVLTVAPVGGDTLQGAVAAVTVPPSGAMLLASDGVSNWTIVASYGGSGTAAGAASQCLIYQPGGAQTGPGIFNTWAALMTQLAVLRAANNGGGCYTIQFDDSLSSPATIPAGGPYNMADVTWEGVGQGFTTSVSIANGARFSKLKDFFGPLAITSHNVAGTPAVADLASGDFVFLRRAVTIDSIVGGAAFFDLTAAGAGAFIIVNLAESSQLGFALTGPVFSMPGAGDTLFIIKDGNSSIGFREVLVGSATSTLSLASASLQNLETVFPNWAGTVSTPRLDVPPSLVPQPYLGIPSTTTSATSEFGQWRRKNAVGGAISQTLAKISTATGSFTGPGCFELVSESGGGVLTVLPAAGDTINGAASYNCPASGATLFISDGVSNWTVVGKYGNNRYVPNEQWNQQNVVASQTNVALSSQLSVNFDTWKAPRAGSIVGMVSRLTEPRTAGVLTVKATINGVASTLSVVTNAGNTSGGISTQLAGIDKYVAGDLIGMQVTTDGAWLPVTSDLEAYLEIEEVP